MSEDISEPTSHVTLMQKASDQGFSDQLRFDNAATEKHKAEVMYITKENWTLMGEPDVVTVTVTPADISTHPEMN